MNNTAILVRDMLNEDLSRVMELEEECFLEPWTEPQVKYELEQNEFSRSYVAEINGEIVGFAIAYFLFDNASICQIGTAKAYREQGVGSALMKEMFNDCYAKKISFLNLELREENEKAYKFYKSFGFEETIRKKLYYSNGDNAICMTRSMLDGNTWD
ncbi:MAG: ribosomal protein S18-alanine N-acetyltransferase [Coprobacillus sp.]|nr:ribosomal protein S18-alanine N-acetyltransferase [Coprobacillus sp.]